MITETITEILTEARTALESLTITVTDQPHEAVSALVAGVPALLVLASPTIEYMTWTQAEATWTLWALAPTTDPREAATTFEPILAALVEALGIDRAQPETYDIRDRTFPGYTLTLTTQHS